VELHFILAIALSIVAVVPLAFALRGIARTQHAGADGSWTTPDSERQVERLVWHRTYNDRERPPAVRCGRYRLLERLGAGGMATVYHAEDELLHRDVAVKLIAKRFAANLEFVERFHHEGRLWANLTHANIVSILDAGYTPWDFLVMELMDGGDVRTVLHCRGRLSPGQTIHVVSQICDALTFAHQQGVVHGDVSLSNILLRRSDGTAKLADFGLASSGAEVDRRNPGEIMGTPGYLAPEVAWGGQPTPQSDLYGLGVVAYRLLGGAATAQTGDPRATTPLPTAAPRLLPLAQLRPDLPRHMVMAVQQAVALEPDSRQESVAEFHAQLIGRHERPLPVQLAATRLRKAVRQELPRAA